jgi:hypothetical protein
MSRHNELPPVPPANRSTNGTGDQTKIDKDTAGTTTPGTTWLSRAPRLLSRTQRMGAPFTGGG